MVAFTNTTCTKEAHHAKTGFLIWLLKS